MWPKNASNTHIQTFIAVTLSFSWIMAFILSRKPALAIGFAGIMMVFPMMVAMAVNILHHGGQGHIIKSIFPGITGKSLLFAVIYPVGFLILLTLVALITKLATFQGENMIGLIDFIFLPIPIILAMIIAFGEEYGWRAFLLPALAERLGKFKAAAVVGAVWALYQIPAVYLMATVLEASKPLILSLLQGGVVFILSFPLAYCYFLGKGSLIPVLLFRAVWNTINGIFLGSGLEGTGSILQGNLLIVSGEGSLGLALGLIAIYFFHKHLRTTEN